MIPKLSSPFVKAIRTSEGILVWVISAVLGVASAIPTTHLTTKEAAILASGVAALHVISRTALKITGVAKGFGLAPTPFTPPAAVQNVVNEVPVVVGQIAQDVAAVT